VTRASLIIVFGLFLAVLPIEPAGAMPAGEETEAAPGEPDSKADLYRKVLETRSTAGERYQAMREERLESMNRSAARGAGRTSRVPGWKLASPKSAPPREDPTDTKGLYLLLLVGAGVILSLALRVFAPFLYDRKSKHTRAGEPMILKLKPREERKLHRT